MSLPLNRRRFLCASAGLITGAGAAAFGRGFFAEDPPAEKAPLFKISLAQWSLHRRFFDDKADPRDFARFELDGHRLLARLRMPYLRRLYHCGTPLILVETIDAGTPPQRRLSQSSEINRKRGRVMAQPGEQFKHGIFIRRAGRAHTPA